VTFRLNVERRTAKFSLARNVTKNHFHVFGCYFAIAIKVKNFENEAHLSVKIGTIDFEHQLHKFILIDALLFVALGRKSK